MNTYDIAQLLYYPKKIKIKIRKIFIREETPSISSSQAYVEVPTSIWRDECSSLR